MTPIILKALKDHGVPYKNENGILLAGEEYTKEQKYFCDWVNTSAWSIKDLKNFLGY